jgi:alpha-galactosidase
MRVDPLFVHSIARIEGGVVLRFSARVAFALEKAVTELFSASFEELATLVAIPTAAQAGFLEKAKRLIFANGWQSWSFAGELARGERVRPAIIKPVLNTYVFREGPREQRNEILSHFLTHIRVGEKRLVLASRGASIEHGGAPVAFRIDRNTLALSVEILSRGARHSPDDPIAELVIGWCSGTFAERDFLRRAFSKHHRFADLDFLFHKGRLVPGGYESWYNHYTAITESLIREQLEAIKTNDNLINSYFLSRGRPTVFQIDDGWETAVGEWTAHEGKFPGGMAALAQDIDSSGMIPGLWVAPFLVTRSSRVFNEHQEWLLRDDKGAALLAGWNDGWDGNFHTLDLSIPEVLDYLDGLFETIVNAWGYRYLKLDFLYSGMLDGSFAGGGAAWQHYEAAVSRITSRTRDARGRPIAWLGCGAPLEQSFRYFPLMRIGADTRETWEFPLARFIRHQGRPAARVNLLHSLGRSLFDGAVFINDPDVVFCRELNITLTETEKELITLVAGMFASQIMSSDDIADFGRPGELAFTARMVALLDQVSQHEFLPERIGQDLFMCASRDGKFFGYMNLRNSSAFVANPEAASIDLTDALVVHAEKRTCGFLLAPRSITLFPLP